MAIGEGITITAAFREKFNTFVGAEVLSKDDEGLALIDEDIYANPVTGEATNRLNKSNDGVIGIGYTGVLNGFQKVIAIDGSVTGFFCPRVTYTKTAEGRTAVCQNTYEKAYTFKKGDAEITIDDQTMTLAVVALFGLGAVPNAVLQKIDNPAKLRSAQVYFEAFAVKAPPLPDDFRE